MKTVLLQRADIIGQKYSNLVENFTRYKNPIIANGKLGTHTTVNHDGDEIIGNTTFEPGDKPWKVVSRIFGAGNTQSNRTAIASNAIYTIDVATSSSQFALRATVRKDRATILSDPLVCYGTNGTIGSVGGLWYSLEYDGDKTYTLSVSSDNQTWRSVSAESIEDDPHTPHTIVGAAVFGNTDGWETYIDLNKHIITSLFDTAIYIDGHICWTPYLDKSKMLPDEYQEVEYIGNEGFSTTHPCISTKVRFTNGPIRVKAKFKALGALSAGHDILGIYATDYDGGPSFMVRVSKDVGDYYVKCGEGDAVGVHLTETSLVWNSDSIIEIDAYESAGNSDSAELRVTFTVDGVSETITKTGKTKDNTKADMTIVGGGRSWGLFNGYVFGNVQAWNDGKLVLDAVPCYRKSDNKKGMYNIAKQEFLTHFTAYAFDIGNDVQTVIPEYAYYFES